MLHPRFGGPPSVVASHMRALQSQHCIKVFGCGTKTEQPVLDEIFSSPWLAAPSWPQWWMRARGLNKAVLDWRPDIIHCHDVWLHGLFASWRAARTRPTPLILTPHGIFTAAWRHQSLHKRCYRWLLFNHMVRAASAIHVLNTAEADAWRAVGLPDRCVVIPNGIPASEFRPADPRTHRNRLISSLPVIGNRRILLYLGRLWSGKGLDMLPDCWASVRRDNWILVLAGPDYRDYRATLERRIAALGITNDVLFTGHLDGEQKRDLLQASDVFILPSHGEGFSMSVIEALAAGTPCILTTACNFPELAIAGGGWECKDDTSSLTSAISQATAMPPDALAAMGARARDLGVRHYTAEAVAQRLSDLYQRVIEEATCR